jgi:hypothetical protein
MTLERDGCCAKWLGCCVFTPGCQNDMYMHVGDFEGRPGVTKPEGEYFGRSVVPIGGGGCTPTLNLTTKSRPRDQAFAVVEGPGIFAGWKGLCCGDVFKVSSSAGGAGDLGLINKREARGCWENYLRMFINVNIYEFAFTDKYQAMLPEDKAVVFGSIVHLNYLFFKNDAPPVWCRPTDDGKGLCIICTLFQCYCKGCVIPCVRQGNFVSYYRLIYFIQVHKAEHTERKGNFL